MCRHQSFQRFQGRELLEVSVWQCRLARIFGSVNVPELLQMVLDHVVASSNSYNIRFGSTEVDHRRTPPVVGKFDPAMVDDEICNFGDLRGDILEHKFSSW